ncbi:hypothetical protein [Mycetocola tolaasinivorans]|uniref:hypothetical protein n=1 Tax=Mycetocola tolaasinivorans TaxID=76635 RepID=UPI0011C472F8|nr:hypothetical protein [Mycetocola tolaasinivorans]
MFTDKLARCEASYVALLLVAIALTFGIAIRFAFTGDQFSSAYEFITSNVMTFVLFGVSFITLMLSFPWGKSYQLNAFSSTALVLNLIALIFSTWIGSVALTEIVKAHALL